MPVSAASFYLLNSAWTLSLSKYSNDTSEILLYTEHCPFLHQALNSHSLISLNQPPFNMTIFNLLFWIYSLCRYAPLSYNILQYIFLWLYTIIQIYPARISLSNPLFYLWPVSCYPRNLLCICRLCCKILWIFLLSTSIFHIQNLKILLYYNTLFIMIFNRFISEGYLNISWY